MATRQFKLPEQYNISQMPEMTIEVGKHTLRPTVVTQQPEWDRLLYDVFAKYWPDVYKYENKPRRRSKTGCLPFRRTILRASVFRASEERCPWCRATSAAGIRI
jgi:hypothetical protein